MDRSYLSDIKVVEASRKFVCIRPISYEDEAENKFLKSFGAGRSGDVENTVLRRICDWRLMWLPATIYLWL